MNRRSLLSLLGIAPLVAACARPAAQPAAPIDGLMQDSGLAVEPMAYGYANYTGPFLYLSQEMSDRFVEVGYPPYMIKVVGPMVIS